MKRVKTVKNTVRDATQWAVMDAVTPAVTTEINEIVLHAVHEPCYVEVTEVGIPMMNAAIYKETE